MAISIKVWATTLTPILTRQVTHTITSASFHKINLLPNVRLAFYINLTAFFRLPAQILTSHFSAT